MKKRSQITGLIVGLVLIIIAGGLFLAWQRGWLFSSASLDDIEISMTDENTFDRYADYEHKCEAGGEVFDCFINNFSITNMDSIGMSSILQYCTDDTYSFCYGKNQYISKMIPVPDNFQDYQLSQILINDTGTHLAPGKDKEYSYITVGVTDADNPLYNQEDWNKVHVYYYMYPDENGDKVIERFDDIFATLSKGPKKLLIQMAAYYSKEEMGPNMEIYSPYISGLKLSFTDTSPPPITSSPTVSPTVSMDPSPDPTSSLEPIESCSSNDDCSLSQFCEFEAIESGDLSEMGICINIPEECDDTNTPVCGTDAITYTNDCHRQQAKVSKKSDEKCETVPEGEVKLLEKYCEDGVSKAKFVWKNTNEFTGNVWADIDIDDGNAFAEDFPIWHMLLGTGNTPSGVASNFYFLVPDSFEPYNDPENTLENPLVLEGGQKYKVRIKSDKHSKVTEFTAEKCNTTTVFAEPANLDIQISEENCPHFEITWEPNTDYENEISLYRVSITELITTDDGQTSNGKSFYTEKGPGELCSDTLCEFNTFEKLRPDDFLISKGGSYKVEVTARNGKGEDSKTAEKDISNIECQSTTSPSPSPSISPSLSPSPSVSPTVAPDYKTCDIYGYVYGFPLDSQYPGNAIMLPGANLTFYQEDDDGNKTFEQIATFDDIIKYYQITNAKLDLNRNLYFDLKREDYQDMEGEIVNTDINKLCNEPGTHDSQYDILIDQYPKQLITDDDPDAPAPTMPEILAQLSPDFCPLFDVNWDYIAEDENPAVAYDIKIDKKGHGAEEIIGSIVGRYYASVFCNEENKCGFEVDDDKPCYDYDVSVSGFNMVGKSSKPGETSIYADCGECEVSKGASLSGKIVGKDGQSVEGATCTVYFSPNDAGSNNTSTTTDKDGNFLLTNVPYGERDLFITKDGYILKHISGIKIGENQAKQIEKDIVIYKLEENKGVLELSSVPSEATVYIDDEEKGTTPLELELPPSSHKIELVKEGYERYIQYIDTVAGETIQILANLNTPPPINDCSIDIRLFEYEKGKEDGLPDDSILYGIHDENIRVRAYQGNGGSDEFDEYLIGEFYPSGVNRYVLPFNTDNALDKIKQLKIEITGDIYETKNFEFDPANELCGASVYMAYLKPKQTLNTHCAITGTVSNAKTKAKLSGAEVKIGENSVTTDKNGTYRIENIPAEDDSESLEVIVSAQTYGEYTNTLSGAGYSTQKCQTDSEIIINAELSSLLAPPVPPVSECGNSICEVDEDCKSCEADCGKCGTKTAPPAISPKTKKPSDKCKYNIDYKENRMENIKLFKDEEACFALYNDKNSTHTIKPIEIDHHSAILRISSNAQDIQLNVNESQYVDVNQDGKNDIILSLGSTIGEGDYQSTLNYTQLVAVTDRNVSPGEEITIDLPGFDDGESVTIIVRDPNTGEEIFSQVAVVKDGKVTVRIPEDAPGGKAEVEVASNVMPDKLVSTGININANNMWLWATLIGLIVLAIIIAIIKSKKDKMSTQTDAGPIGVDRVSQSENGNIEEVTQESVESSQKNIESLPQNISKEPEPKQKKSETIADLDEDVK